jgi:hypothetical protein
LWYSVVIGLNLEPIYGPAYLSYAPLEQVVEKREWQGTEAFEVLVAPSDCNLLGKWVWLIVEDGQVLSGVVVDCERPEHQGQMDERRLLADVNDWDLVHKKAWLVVR